MFSKTGPKNVSTETSLICFSEGHYVTKKFFVRFQLLEAIFLFALIPSNLPMRKIMAVKFFRNLGLSEMMTSYLTVSEFFSLQNMTFYIPLERKFNADQVLIRNLGLNMYGTEVMTS